MPDERTQPPFPIKFRFEQGTMRLKGGQLFTPLDDAADRWTLEVPAPYLGLGCNWHILYRLSDGRFVYVAYQFCQPESSRPDALWVSDDPPTGEFVSETAAAEYLLKCQFPVPLELRAALEAQPELEDKPPNRPLEYWQAYCRERPPSQASITTVDHLAMAQRIADRGFRFVQFLRTWDDPSAVRSCTDAWELCYALTRRHRVLPSEWPADEEGIPPDAVDWLEWKWPAELTSVQTHLKQLRAVSEPALNCVIGTRGPVGSPETPTDEELEQARLELTKRAPLIEQLVVDLRRSLQAVKRETAAPEPTHEVVREDRPDVLTDQGRVRKRLNELSERVRMAFLSYEHGVQRVLPEPGHNDATDKQVYDWLKENGIDEYQFPVFETWVRYLRAARQHIGMQKYRPRHGRDGGSVRKADEL